MKRPTLDVYSSRRDFLRRALGAAAFVPLAAACGAAPGGFVLGGDAGVAPDGGTAMDGGLVVVPDGGIAIVDGGGAADGGLCEPTHADVLGPFHRPDAPFSMTIAAANEMGERLFVSGIVRGPDCVTPVEGAVVDIWQANAAGRYDNDNPNRPPPADVFRLRGRVTTNAEGRYAFESIVPGRYLNGARYRPSHVHYRVTAPGRTTLVTQLYFEGDPFLEGDPFAEEGRAIPLRRDGSGARGEFDIVLA